MNSPTYSDGVVLLYSYRRPNLTQEAIKRLLEWKNLDKLYVSIDGLKESSSFEEAMWRSETIIFAEKAAEFSDKIELLVWKENLGLTHHANRALRQIFTSHQKVISLEEDNFISVEGLEFLNDIPINCGSPHIKSSFTKFYHSDSPNDKKFSIFPEQWGISFNMEMYQRYLEVQKKEDVDIQIINEQIFLVLGRKRNARRVAKHWIKLFRESLESSNFGDGLMQYAALSSGTFYEVPWRTYTIDLGHLDDRGIHGRTKHKKSLVHTSHKTRINGLTFCIKCEKYNSGWYAFKYPKKIISIFLYKTKLDKVLFKLKK